MKKIYTDLNGLVTKVVTINDEPTRTDQTQKAQCDIKNIMTKYGGMKNIPPLQGGFQGDFTNIPSYQSALHAIRDANDSFAALPSNVRKKFQNDPAEMISFLEDPTNNEEAYKLGLKIKPTTPQPTEAEIYYANQNAKHKTAKKTSTGNTDSDE